MTMWVLNYVYKDTHTYTHTRTLEKLTLSKKTINVSTDLDIKKEGLLFPYSRKLFQYLKDKTRVPDLFGF